MRIFLLGYMGAGKTTVGKKLAAKLQFRFVDLDQLIETRLEKSISEIFEQEGENYFRKQESQTLEDLLKEDDIVVSTGGGTPCFFQNMEFMNKSGETVYLKMSKGALVSRLINAKSSRPLIKEKSKEELEEFISQSLLEREVYYMQSHYIVDALNINIDDLVDLIKQK